MFEKGNTYGFKKGESGNPDGRPKGSLSIKDTMRKYLDMKVKDIDPALVQQIAGKSKEFSKKYGNKTLRDAMVIAYARKALAGDWTYLEHLEGKAPQSINIGGQEDNPIKIEIEYVDSEPEDADKKD